MDIPKKAQSPDMFTGISRRYELGNHILSFGLDMLWRKRLVKLVAKNDPNNVLDVATGTGDVAFALATIPSIQHITGVDPSSGMLQRANERKRKKFPEENDTIIFVEGDAQNLSMKDASVDAITISFGIRNVPNVQKALEEFSRVLKQGGGLYILEFSLPENRFIRKGYLLYLRFVLPIIGGVVTGNRQAYTYLNKTIEEFPKSADVVASIKEAGFKNVQVTRMLFGAVKIYEAKNI